MQQQTSNTSDATPSLSKSALQKAKPNPLASNRYTKLLSDLWSIFFLLISFVTYGQEQFQVRAAIDSTSIEMGSVVNYAIQVQENRDKLVVFPEGDSFSPLEVIKSFKTDTLDEGGRYRLLKQYALTQFDSGHYTIPKQKIVIGNKTFYTDSLQVEVRDIAVDTSKQKLYPIKGLQAVEDLSETNWWRIVYWVLGILILIALVAFLYWKFGGKKKLKEEDLPAYDQAVLALNRIEVDTLIETKQYKQLYSKLTDIAKGYLDKEVAENALESTTDEVVNALQQLMKKGKLSIKKSTLEAFENTLKTADFAKFAAINPSEETALLDKKFISEFINSVEQGKPELTEEEKLQNEAYRLAQEKKQKEIKQRRTIVAGILALVVGLLTFVAVTNYESALDFVLKRTGNTLLRKNWITSTYGVPGVQVTTPEVLTRQPIKLEGQQQQMFVGNQLYTYGELSAEFYLVVNTMSFRQDIGFTLDKSGEFVSQFLSTNLQAKNIELKDEDFKTLDGTEAKKVFGSVTLTIPETEIETDMNYTTLIFGDGQGIQSVSIFYKADDKSSYKVMERIINSVEIKKSDN